MVARDVEVGIRRGVVITGQRKGGLEGGGRRRIGSKEDKRAVRGVGTQHRVATRRRD